LRLSKRWKTISETAALRSLERLGESADDELLFLRLELLMPELLDEIRNDLKAKPLSREFVLLKKGWIYWASGHELSYYYEDHAFVVAHASMAGSSSPKSKEHPERG